MIKFFRKIRFTLLKQNKIGNYLKYAVGEIVLVVIGILIALQINDWNQTRLQRIEEKEMIKNLHEEFVHNKSVLQATLQVNNRTSKSLYHIWSLIGKSSDTIIRSNPDSIFFEAIYFKKFIPSENAISDIVQSGALKKINKEKIKDLIYKWSTIMKENDKNYTVVELQVQNDLVPYMLDYYPLKDIDFYTGTSIYKSKSKLKHDKYKVFYEIKFESLIDDAMWRMNYMIETLNEAGKIIDEIIDVTRY